MAIRIVKTLLALCIAFMCLFFALQNLANLEQAHGAVGYVTSNQDHVVYPGTFAFSISHPVLTGIALAVILTGEFLAGLLCLAGAWKMWSARTAANNEFAHSKRLVTLGTGVALLVWFGLFHVLGGALFQQWQTEIGTGSLTGAFWYAALPCLALLFITQTPDD